MDTAAIAKELIKEQIEASGFEQFGFATLEKPLSMEIYRAWIADGHHGSMHYLAEHVDLKANPRRLSSRAVSAIVVAKCYLPHPYKLDSPAPSLRTALYAQGEDYHWKFKNELERVAKNLRQRFPDEEFLCFTDSAPILERDLAYRAGLGWVGKNTCLIDPEKRQLVFSWPNSDLPLVNREHEAGERFLRNMRPMHPRVPDRGSHRAAQTGCDQMHFLLDHRAAAENAPSELRAKLGDWFFGCDICQTVCPWNEKAHGRDLLSSLSNQAPPPALEDLRWILTSSNKALEKAFRKSPVIRARARGLKRNALQIVGNLKITDLRPEVERQWADPYLGEIARWALAQLT